MYKIPSYTVYFFVLLWSSFILAGDGEGVLTDTGSPLKIVVRRDCAIYEQPDQTSKNWPARMFEFYYVLSAGNNNEKLKGDFYRIGTDTKVKSMVGWIHKNDIVEWPHRQALGFRPIAGRDLAAFYKNKDDLKSVYKGKSLEPLSREPDGGGGIKLMPINERFEMTVEGDEVFAYRVAYIHSKAGRSGKGGSEAARTKIDLDKSTLDIVFVIDTTMSMQPFIDATKRVVNIIVDELPKRFKDIPVRFGLVGYRDVVSAPPQGWYVSEIFCDLEVGADHSEFLKILSNFNAANSGSEDTPEDVLAGLKKAIQDSKWNPHGFKQVILLGDASAQTEMSSPKNAEELTISGVLAMAQPSGRETVQEKKIIHAVRIISKDSEDYAKCEEHFKQLAAGEDMSGEYREFNGDPSGARSCVTELVDIIRKSAAGLVSIKKKIQPADNTPGLGLLLEMVSASSETRGDAPQFASGFGCEIDLNGNQVFEPFVLVQHGQFETFRSALDFSINALKNAGDPGSKDINKIVKTMQILATMVFSGEPVNPDTKLSDILNLILGFPVRSKIFDMSISTIGAMSAADFQSWLQQMDACKSIIKSHLDNEQVWFLLGKDTSPEKKHCFVKVKDLP
ncbi:MAG: VWA domain-containing protein [Colwellia sp.]|nr:VWA domain-containing protein [Colwellia sp.]